MIFEIIRRTTYWMTSTRSDDRLLTKKQAASRLAISVRTLDRMVARRILEKVFVGNAPRFRKSDIDAIITNGV